MTKKARKTPTPIKLKYNKPDISDWQLDALDTIAETINKSVSAAANEAIRLALEDARTGVSWGAEWTDEHGYGDGHATGDVAQTILVPPLMMHLTIAIGDGDDHPIYSFDLRDSLLNTIELCREDGSFSTGLARISSALRSLCDEIDAALPNT